MSDLKIPYQGDEVVELPACIRHHERVDEFHKSGGEIDNRCLECPSRPDNRERIMREAQGRSTNYRAELLAQHNEHTTLLRKMIEGFDRLRKEVKQVYLIIASVIAIVSTSWLRVIESVEEKTWLIVTVIALFPWFGEGIERFLYLRRGSQDGRNHVAGILGGLLVSSIGAAAIQLLS